MDAVAEVLESRGIDAAAAVTKDRELYGGIPGKVVMAAAVACTDEADFLRRIRGQRALHAGPPPYPDPEASVSGPSAVVKVLGRRPAKRASAPHSQGRCGPSSSE